MPETAAYKEWLASGDTSGALIETIEVSHPAWAEVQYFVNWDVSLTCTIEDDGVVREQEFAAARFIYENAPVDSGTEQATRITIAAYEGIIYENLKKMTPDDRMSPILLRPRHYLSTKLESQLINPSPIWTVHAVTATHEAVGGDLQVAPLRAHRVGRYYTSLEFPVLVLS